MRLGGGRMLGRVASRVCRTRDPRYRYRIDDRRGERVLTSRRSERISSPANRSWSLAKDVA